MSDNQVLSTVRGRLGIITLNRPEAINSLSLEMLSGVDRALSEFQNDPGVAAVLMHGAGERGLCAGGDIVALYRAIEAGEFGYCEEYFRAEYRLNYRIATYPKPYISLMDGVVLGGGIGVGAHGGHRIVTERTRAGMPETVIGFSPDVGGLKLLAEAPRQLGTMMAMTGMHISASDALVCGLADHFVPSESLDQLYEQLQATTDAQSIEQVISRFVGEAPESRLAENAYWINDTFAGSDAVAIRDRVGALAEEGNELASEVVAALRNNSPTGIKMALYGIRRAEVATLAQTLNTDFVVTYNSCFGHDLREGIRAQVIDKDRTPRWQPGDLEEVADDVVTGFFTAPAGLEPLGLA